MYVNKYKARKCVQIMHTMFKRYLCYKCVCILYEQYLSIYYVKRLRVVCAVRLVNGFKFNST